MLSYLIYFSKASGLMTEQSLQQILEESRKWNTDHQLTGMLVYVEGKFLTGEQDNEHPVLEGRFMQVLEGKDADVKEIFEKIRLDDRHQDLVVLKQGAIAERSFKNWDMGFKHLDHPDDLAGFINLNDWQQPILDDNQALNFLKSFYQAVNNKNN
jgi:hypothetical protein